ncbi:hypothetical protein CHS0354_028636 [Potamilus streckersoni]|uniref:Uncharacterized protein n=1 Tax=Potamilus streckersoni TaxID=2493646 RepID=A0AAE0W3U6_9BIVA|nr:hypothetical protein CHS0354_028636 [Potamilus streckersoni]
MLNFMQGGQINLSYQTMATDRKQSALSSQFFCHCSTHHIIAAHRHVIVALQISNQENHQEHWRYGSEPASKRSPGATTELIFLDCATNSGLLASDQQEGLHCDMPDLLLQPGTPRYYQAMSSELLLQNPFPPGPFWHHSAGFRCHHRGQNNTAQGCWGTNAGRAPIG